MTFNDLKNSKFLFLFLLAIRGEIEVITIIKESFLFSFKVGLPKILSNVYCHIQTFVNINIFYFFLYNTQTFLPFIICKIID